MWQFRFEVAVRQAVSALNAAEDVEACDRARYTLALYPRKQGFCIKRFVYPNDRSMELPVTLAKATHLIGEGIFE